MTTETLVAMEEEDDFDDPLTSTPVKGQLRNRIKCTPFYPVNV